MVHNEMFPEGAEWKSVPCWHNCGGRCLVKVLMKDGEVIRHKTDDLHPDTWGRLQARSCPMGHAMAQQIFGEDRVKYPMKRKGWSPDNPNGQMRGVDEWERISWDEALDYVAEELKKAKEKYGNRSIFYMNMLNLEGYLGQVLSAFGGYVDNNGTQSTGTFNFNPAMYGMVLARGNDRMDILNSDYIVLYAHNAAWCTFGSATMYLKYAKEHGVKFVYVGPDYAATAAMTNAEWIPVRPGGDTALLLGVAYSMYTRDGELGLIDWDYLNRCTVGFDADHMPAGARTDECFLDYLLGKSDGVPKTQEWASELCGTPVELIDRFADILSCKNDVAIHSANAASRCKGAENLPQLLMTVAAMGGHFGKPGNMCMNDPNYFSVSAGAPITGMAPLGSPFMMQHCDESLVDDVLPTDGMWDAILDGHYWFAGNNLWVPNYKPGEERDIDIHVIVSDHHNFLSSQANTNKGITAFRKVDFVFSLAYYMKLDAQYADIVLPITTRWERNSGNVYSGFKDRELLFASGKVTDALFEARDDRGIAAGIAERLGLDYEEINPLEDQQTWFNQISSAVVMSPEGIPTPVAAITQEDLDRYGVYGEPRPGIMPFEQFLADGVYRVEREADDGYVTIGLKEFREDPEANPIETDSGKMEIYCQAKEDFFDAINGYANGGEGYGSFVKVGPLPKWIDAPLSYKASFEDWDAKVPGKYPVQYTHFHYLRRAHTDCDNLPWLREALVNPVMINRDDAAARGIENGDIVRVYNDEGEFLRPAAVVRTVMPGVIMVPHGAGARIDRETGIDIAGADNMLTDSTHSTTPHLNAWNSNLCQYEKYDGPIEVLPDYLMDPIIPIAE